jgi:hypothetical protein
MSSLAHRDTEKYLKRLAGKTEIDDALQKLDSLTQAEAVMVAARGLALVDGLDSKMDLLQKRASNVSKLNGTQKRLTLFTELETKTLTRRFYFIVPMIACKPQQAHR